MKKILKAIFIILILFLSICSLVVGNGHSMYKEKIETNEIIKQKNKQTEIRVE